MRSPSAILPTKEMSAIVGVTKPAKEMGDVVTELGNAAYFHRGFAELCETAERLLDVAMSAA